MMDLIDFVQRRRSWLPLPWRYAIAGAIFGRHSPFFRTCGIELDAIAPDAVRLQVRERRRLRSRTGSLHVMAASLACEYAAGFLVAQHVDRRAVQVVVRRVRFDFKRPLAGAIFAEARFDGATPAALQGRRKGRVSVSVAVRDGAGANAIGGEVDVVWLPYADA